MRPLWCSVLLILLLAGCAQQGSKQIDLPDVRTGTQGLAAGFLPQTPPAQVYESSLFTVLLNVENRGAADVKRGRYVIAAPEQYVIFQESPGGFLDVQGRSVYNPRGGQQRIGLKGLAAPLGAQMETLPVNLLLTLCYPYETQASATVCVDPDTAGLQKGKPCSAPEKRSLSGGQGAPVGVTGIETVMLPHMREDYFVPQVSFDIQNLGTGTVVADGSELDICEGRPIDREMYNTVRVQGFLSETPMKCTEKAVLREGKARVVCTLEEGIPAVLGTYPSPVRINLNYGYVESQSKEFRIQKIVSR